MPGTLKVMRIYAAVYTTTDQPRVPRLLDARSAEHVEVSPAGWRAVLAQEAAGEDIAAIASVVLDVPDGALLAALTAPPPVIPATATSEGE